MERPKPIKKRSINPTLFPLFTATLSIVLATLSSLSLGFSIYGSDDRQDYFEIANDPDGAHEFLAYAHSIPMLISRSNWRLDSDGYYRPIKPLTTHGKEENLCRGVRFANQPHVGFCTGFMVGEELIATAGHCIENQTQCDDTLLVFDLFYENDARHPMKIVDRIPADKVYECKKLVLHDTRSEKPIVGAIPITRRSIEPVLSRMSTLPLHRTPRMVGNQIVWEYIGPSLAPTPLPYNESEIPTIELSDAELNQPLARIPRNGERLSPDLSLIQLDRPISGRTPLKLNLSGVVYLNQNVAMLGYPRGIPLKIDLNGKVIRTHDGYAQYDLKIDAFHGNSGSPILDRTTGEVIGVLVSGQSDLRARNSPRNRTETETPLPSATPAPNASASPAPCNKNERVRSRLKEDWKEYGESASRFSTRFIQALSESEKRINLKDESTP